jgi:hypothetical protein
MKWFVSVCCLTSFATAPLPVFKLQQVEAFKDKIVPPQHPVYGLLVKVAQNIIDRNQDIDLLKQQKWTVIVVDSPEENAFVLPVCAVKCLACMA